MKLCTLTCKCSKCIRGQFPEDDWVGGPVSLEHLRETKTLWYYAFLFHHWCSQVLVSMFICVHLGHCHIYILYSKVKSKTCLYLFYNIQINFFNCVQAHRKFIEWLCLLYVARFYPELLHSVHQTPAPSWPPLWSYPSWEPRSGPESLLQGSTITFNT